MNAILRHECEAPVLTHEAIEVHLSYLRPAMEALSAKLDHTNERIDQANKDRAAGETRLTEKMTAGDALLAERITATEARLTEKITALDVRLSQKIDQARNETHTALDELRKALEDMRKTVLKIDSRQSAIIWVGAGLIALITLAVTVGKAFNWF